MELLGNSSSAEHFSSLRDHFNLTYLESLVSWQCHNTSNFIETKQRTEIFNNCFIDVKEWIIHGFRVSVNNSNYLLLKDRRPTKSTLAILIEHLVSSRHQNQSPLCVWTCLCVFLLFLGNHYVLCFFWPLIQCFASCENRSLKGRMPNYFQLKFILHFLSVSFHL